MTLTLRYDGYDADAVLTVSVKRADEDGEPISPPLLQLTDGATGDSIHLTREQAWKLRALIQSM
jgi:methionine aminopeptidase